MLAYKEYEVGRLNSSDKAELTIQKSICGSGSE